MAKKNKNKLLIDIPEGIDKEAAKEAAEEVVFSLNNNENTPVEVQQTINNPEGEKDMSNQQQSQAVQQQQQPQPVANNNSLQDLANFQGFAGSKWTGVIAAGLSSAVAGSLATYCLSDEEIDLVQSICVQAGAAAASMTAAYFISKINMNRYGRVGLCSVTGAAIGAAAAYGQTIFATGGQSFEE